MGKSTLVNTLFNTSLYQDKGDVALSNETPKTVDIQSISAGNIIPESIFFLDTYFALK
jgi:septin family protein